MAPRPDRRAACARLLLLLVMVAAAPVAAGPFPVVSAAPVSLNGHRIPVAALVVDGVSYLPLDAVKRALHARVEWDPTTDAVAVNGHLLRALPFHRNGAVYLPVDAVCHLLNLRAGWDPHRKQITLRGTSPVAMHRAPVRRHPAAASHRRSPIRAAWHAGPMPHLAPSPTRQPAYQEYGPDGLPVDQSASPAPPAAPASTAPPAASRLPFAPVSRSDGVFAVTVTDLVELTQVRGYYTPPPGMKFIQVSLSQQNMSNELQIYTGKFSLVDDHDRAYDALENISNFWLVILKPGGINFGYLIYAIPQGSQPARLVLHTRGTAPLAVGLR